LTQIRQRRAATSAAPADVASAPVSAAAPLDGLAKQGMRAGYSPRALAEAVGLTMNLLGKLEARAIAAASIPPTLVRRLAATLTVAPESVASYLGLSPTPQVGAFYYADQPPTQQQEAFLDAVQGSALSPEHKREWVEIAERDAASGA
jgi:transcriptional regulator with XRE-family HTH domain